MTTTAIDIEAVRKRMDEQRITDGNALPDEWIHLDEDGGAFVRFPDGSWAALTVDRGWESGDEEIEVDSGSSSDDIANGVPPYAFVAMGILSEEEFNAIQDYERERERQRLREDAERKLRRQEADERATYERLRRKFEQA